MFVGPGEQMSYGCPRWFDLGLQTPVGKSSDVPFQIVPNPSNVSEDLTSLADLQESRALEALGEERAPQSLHLERVDRQRVRSSQSSFVLSRLVFRVCHLVGGCRRVGWELRLRSGRF
jgi:hypothetical protein